jgi:hypothetical protein
MEIKPAPPCKHCGRIYVDGSLELCRECLLGRFDTASPPKPSSLRCDCGRRAITVILISVGEDGVYTMRLPLCERCLKIEQMM